MPNGIVRVPEPVNDPVRTYAPGSSERASLKKRLDRMLSERIEIPLIIGGEEVRTGNTAEAVCPHDHGHVLATFHQAGEREVAQAIDAAKSAWKEWSEMPWEARAAVLLKAADLLAGPWRDTINASTRRSGDFRYSEEEGRRFWFSVRRVTRMPGRCSGSFNRWRT